MVFTDPMDCALALNVALVAPVLWKMLDVKANRDLKASWTMRRESERAKEATTDREWAIRRVKADMKNAKAQRRLIKAKVKSDRRP